MKYSTKQDIGTFGYIISMWIFAIILFMNGDWFLGGIIVAFGLVGFTLFRIFDMNDKLRDANVLEDENE